MATIQEYIARTVDSQLQAYLEAFGAVCLVGPKWCGKTTTAQHHSASSLKLADPEGGYRARSLAQLEPALALEGGRPRLIDEWQDVPQLWDAVRYQVDADGMKGSFILTGSSAPRKGDRPVHSGAGRIARLSMSTMTLQEMGLSSGRTSLADILAGSAVPAAQSTMDLRTLADAIARGGWPGALGLSSQQALLVSREYVELVADEDLSKIDGVQRDPAKIRRLLVSLARNESTLASKRTLLSDTAGAEGVSSLSVPTLDAYLSALRSIYYVDDVAAWDPALKSPVRMRSSVKRHLADPSLAVAALGANAEALIADLKLMGNLFESLALHDLRVYARYSNARVYHYNDASGLEVDAVVETQGGDWVPFEIKLGAAQVDAAAANVTALERKMLSHGERPPLAKCVIVGVGGFGHVRDDGVRVVPLDTLGI